MRDSGARRYGRIAASGALAAAAFTFVGSQFAPSSGAVTAHHSRAVPHVTQAGNCSQDGGKPLGGVYRDGVVAVPACGPRPLFSSCNTTDNCPVYPYPGAGTPYPGYQCAEITARYMWYRFHAAERLANGDGQAAVYAAAYPNLFTLYHNGAVGHAPQEGDVISMSGHTNFQDGDGGHVAIVQSVSASVRTKGTGTINLVDENDLASGTNTLSISNWSVEEGINNYSYFEWLQPKSFGLAGGDVSGQVAAGRDASGELQLFMVGANHSMYTRYQTSAANWSGSWSPLGGAFPTSDQIGVATNQAGELELLAVDNGGAMQIDTQTAGSAYLKWTGWKAFGSSLFPAGGTALNVIANSNGQPQAFVVGTDAQVYTSWQPSSGGWVAWRAIGGNFSKDGSLGVGINVSGKLQLFALGPTGQLLSNLQITPNAYGSWHGWDPLEGGNFPGDQGAAIGADENGKLQIYAVTTTGTLDSSHLTSGWSPFFSMHGTLNRADFVATGMNLSGKQQLFAIGTNGVLDSIYEVGADEPTSWHPWSTLDPADQWPKTDDVTVTEDQTGHMHVFLVGFNGSLYSTYQNASNNWMSFASLGGAWPSE